MQIIEYLHHAYYGAALAAFGVWLEVQTWDANGNYAPWFPYQDVWGWGISGFGIFLIMSDLVEHFVQKEKHN